MNTEQDMRNRQMVTGNVKLKEDGSLTVSFVPGETLYVLGTNGSGKSTLLYSWAKQYSSVVLIAGNREIALGSSAVSISATEAKQETGYVRKTLHNPEARVTRTHHNNLSRLNRLLFLLKSRSDDANKRYRLTNEAGKARELEEIVKIEPMTLLNEALRRASLPLEIDWSRDSELMVTKTGCTDDYGAQELSDGERASLILASKVILADQDAIILVDEPERHLHRSISSPLLHYLRSIRPDLCWVIATHDLSLPRDDAAATILLLYEYYGGGRWHAELISDLGTISPALAEAIYGARQKVLFVEGITTSKDAPLYRQLFKDITVVPVGNCRDVSDAVTGLKAVPSLHHMEARGLVDGDNRGDTEILKKKGIAVLSVYAIESIYYHPEIIKIMVTRSAETVSLEEVLNAALAALGDVEHLARKTAYRTYREDYLRAMLDEKAFAEDVQESETIDGSGLVANAKAELEQLKHARNWLAIAERYKIKASGAPKAIAIKLGFLGSDQYENALVKELSQCEELKGAISSIAPDPFRRFSTVTKAA